MADDEAFDFEEISSQSRTPTVQPPPDVQQGLRQEWSKFLADPTGQAAMLQFGLSMLQPIAAGQSAAGQFGQAVGSIGGLAERNRKSDLEDRKMELAEQTADDKFEIGTARLEGARDRLAASTALSEQRLSLQRAGLALREQNLARLSLRDKIDLDRKERAEGRKLNNDELRAFFLERGIELREERLMHDIERDERRLDQGDRRVGQGDQRLDISRDDLERRRTRDADTASYRRERIRQIEKDFGRKLDRDEVARVMRGEELDRRRGRDSFTQSFRESREWNAFVKQQVDSAEKERENLLSPNNRWKGKTRTQIDAEIRNDPQVRQQWMKGRGSPSVSDGAPAPTEPPSNPQQPPRPQTPQPPGPQSSRDTPIPLPKGAAPASLTVGQVYTGPRGDGRWNGRSFDWIEPNE